MSGRTPESRFEDMKLVDEYWAVRKRYETVFGKYDPVAQTACPASERIKEMQDKLDEHYRLQRDGSRTRKLAHA